MEETTFTDDTENKNLQQQEHETHVPALLLLIVLTVVIVGIVIFYQNGSLTNNRESPATTTQSRQVQNNAPQAVSSQPVEGTQDLPEGLLLENATIIENERITRKGKSQRMVMQETSRSLDAVWEYYKDWMEANEFTVTVAKQSDGFLAGESEAKKMTVVINRQPDTSTTRVRFNYLLDK